MLSRLSSASLITALLFTSPSLIPPTEAHIITTNPRSNNNEPSTTFPRNYGVLLPPNFDPLDVVGPIEVLGALSTFTSLTLSYLARSLDPVTDKETNSTFATAIVPTHTLDNPPEGLEVLIIPAGGGGVTPDRDERMKGLEPEVEYIARAYPKLKYLVTVCQGSEIAAHAGVLKGKRATTNKSLFRRISGENPEVKWVSPARWVSDGNIWTASGPISGIDMIRAFIHAVYPPELGTEWSPRLYTAIEYDSINDPNDDPFSGRLGIPPQNTLPSCQA